MSDMNDTDAEADLSPDRQTLKRRRGAAKGVITRLSGQVNLSMSQHLLEETEHGLHTLDEAVSRFIKAHELYQNTLEDEDDIDASAGYRTTVIRDVHDLRHAALTWIEEEREAADNLVDQQTMPSEANNLSPLDQIFAELRELRELRLQEKQELSRLMTEQEERLRKELQLQQHQTDRKPQVDEIKTLSQPTLGAHQLPSPVSEQSVIQLLELSRQQHQAHVDSMRLPPTDLIKFDGEPLKYWLFMRLFSTLVDKETVPDEEKLTRLHQYTVGQARDAIAHCLYHPLPSVGYAEAMATLKKRFGNPYTISQAWVDKVLNYKQIKDNKQLQDFADTLRSCRDTLKAMKCEDELNGGRALLQIVEKLPMDLKKRWLTVNYEITRSGQRAKLDDVVKLVETEAEKRADPIFGSLLGQSVSTNINSTSNNSVSKPKRTQSFAAESKITDAKPFSPFKFKETTFKCPKCNEGHFLNQCSSFRSMTVQGRLTFVRQKKLCQNCFMAGHHADGCSRTWVCKVPGCGQRHNSWLHSAIVVITTNDNNKPTTPATGSEPTTNQRQEVQANATRRCFKPSSSKVALPILPVVVSDPDNHFSINIFALLDSGSNGTFCSKRLIHALRLETRKTNIKLSTMESKSLNIDTLAVDLRVDDPQRKEAYQMKGVLSRDHLNISLNNLVTVDEVSQWPHLQDIVHDICPADINLADEVHLLIGLDQPDILSPREVRRGNPGEPYAILTGLGWTLNGPVAEYQTTISSNFVQRDDSLQQAVERFWKLDDPAHISSEAMSIIDKQVVDLWDKQVVKEDSHYTLPIPFKEHSHLPNNYAMAKHRLELLGKRLKKNPSMHQKYSEGICDSLLKGYAEEVANDDPVDGCIWYLPHHPVLHPRKPGKVRIVFDCAARYQGTSLNDHIHQGPDLTNKLLGVLLKFRQEPVALNADIEGMFYQVRVPPNQRDVLRFLWWQDGDPDKPVKHYRMTSHLFGGGVEPQRCHFRPTKSGRRLPWQLQR